MVFSRDQYTNQRSHRCSSIHKVIQEYKRSGYCFPRSTISQRGKRLLTWQQLKIAKGKAKVGQKAKWFTFIENILLENPINRKIKEIYQTPGPNIFAPVMPVVPISPDNRKREWILLNKENKELETRKIIKKGKSKILTEHWSVKENSLTTGYVEVEQVIKTSSSELNRKYS